MSATLEPPQNLKEALRDFKARFHGAVLEPDGAAYESARALWNGIFDKYPAVIAMCEGVADVIGAVNFARDHNLTIAVRGGGHNVAGLASTDGGIVIDLSEMNAVQVDPASKTARAEGGATIGDLDRETQVFGLAVPMGVVSATGLAGLTLGGGMGWLRRKYGLSCDNLIAADVVTAEGRLVHASEHENAELLWGLRGGGGNFGIVTSFEYQLHEVGPEVAFNVTFYPLSEARRVLRANDAYIRNEPGEVSTVAILGRVPHEEAFPQALHGMPFVAILGMYADEAAEGLDYLRPLRDISEPLLDLSGAMPYLEAQRFFDADYPNGLRYYWKSTGVIELSDEVIATLVKYAERAPSDLSTLDIWYQGGKMAEPAASATAYGRRDIPYLINGEANWQHPQDDEANIAWVRECLAELSPSQASLYLNFPGFQEEGDAMMHAAFGENYHRLVALKNAYDPHNLFRLNQNIRPKGGVDDEQVSSRPST